MSKFSQSFYLKYEPNGEQIFPYEFSFLVMIYTYSMNKNKRPTGLNGHLRDPTLIQIVWSMFSSREKDFTEIKYFHYMTNTATT